MFLLLAFSVFHIVTFVDAEPEDFSPLGRGVYLPRFNLVGDLPNGYQLFNPSALRQCTVKANREKRLNRRFRFFKDTKEFYTSQAKTADLGSSLKTDFSLGVTLEHASAGSSSNGRSVTGNSLLIQAIYSQDTLSANCRQDVQNFDQNFLENFARLPVKIDKPWSSNAWHEYHLFLETYGSHIVTSMSLGSSINQMVFAQTSDSYSERDFQVKSCLFLAGSTSVADLKVSLCAGINENEISRVSEMTMSNNLDIRGGKTETRNKLIEHRTADLIEQFMNEGKYAKSATQYTLTSLWHILQTLYFGENTENLIRAVNLEYYYLGFLNYGCYHKHERRQDLQMFNFAKDSSPTSPQYECSLAPEGCQNDDDCHWNAINWCSCRGPSCIRYRDVKLDYTCEGKTTADINMEVDWRWHGCELSFLHCYCKSPLEERTTVWKIENKHSALYHAHYVSMNWNISKGKDEL